MFKSVSLVLVCAILALYWAESLAAPVSIEEEEHAGMSSAVKRGQERFGGAIPRRNKPDPANLDLGVSSKVPKPSQKIHSMYTAGISSLGGGKPNRNDKHRIHHFVPLSPKVIPWSTGEKYNPEFISPEESAQRWVPHHGYQYTSDEDLH